MARTKKAIIIPILIIFFGGSLFYFWQSGFIFPKTIKEPGNKTSVPLPSSYRIEEVPFYGEENWCWGSSAMMLLMGAGFTNEEIQEARLIIKNEGRGGSPDMFIAFRKYGLIDNVHVAYSKDYIKEYADFYNYQLLENPKEKVILFDNKGEALEKLKELVSSGNLVIIVGHYGNHYMVVTGYDDNYIYLNDPGADKVFFEKVDYQDGYQKEMKMLVDNFLEQWTVSGFEGGGIGFPGDWGMIWLAN